MSGINSALGLGESPHIDAKTEADSGEKALARYRDGYTVAGSISGIGALLKILAWFAGLAGIAAGLLVGQQSGWTFGSNALSGGLALMGLLAALSVYGVGVLASAVGQILRATTDVAVHGSPFLTDAQRASVMGVD